MSPNVVFNDLDDKYKSLKQYRDKNIMFSEIDLLLICCSYDKGNKPLISFENIKSLKESINIVNISCRFS